MLTIYREEASVVSDVFLRHYLTHPSPTFGYSEREQFGEAFFEWLAEHHLVYAEEIQLTLGLDPNETGRPVILARGGFSHVHIDPYPFRLPALRDTGRDSSVSSVRRPVLPSVPRLERLDSASD